MYYRNEIVTSYNLSPISNHIRNSVMSFVFAIDGETHRYENHTRSTIPTAMLPQIRRAESSIRLGYTTGSHGALKHMLYMLVNSAVQAPVAINFNAGTVRVEVSNANPSYTDRLQRLHESVVALRVVAGDGDFGERSDFDYCFNTNSTGSTYRLNPSQGGRWQWLGVPDAYYVSPFVLMSDVAATHRILKKLCVDCGLLSKDDPHRVAAVELFERMLARKSQIRVTYEDHSVEDKATQSWPFAHSVSVKEEAYEQGN